MLFAAISFCVAVASILAGRYLYTAGGKQVTDFYVKLGELALQLAVVVIAGALVKELVDRGLSQRARYREKLEDRKEFMRRIRAMHVTIQNAKDLMNAHGNTKTWSEQSRRLMKLRPEVEEISEDLEASGNLFKKQSEKIDALKAIIAYLKRGGEEYVRMYKAVDPGYKGGRSLLEAIDQESMTWVRDFMAEGEDYQNSYDANLEKSKGAMRLEVYGVRRRKDKFSRGTEKNI